MISKFFGYGVDVELYSDKIIIKRKGFLIKRKSLISDKTIYLKQISHINFALAKHALNGYMTFSLAETRGKSLITRQYEKVFFLKSANEKAITFKAQIEELQSKNAFKSSYVQELKDLDNLRDGFHFEEYTAELLRELDYQNVKVLPRSNDYGADVLAENNGVKYAIQCKYYTNAAVGVSAVQEILGGTAYHNAHVSVVVTNYRFTSNAINLAKANNVILWDRTDLLEMGERASFTEFSEVE